MADQVLQLVNLERAEADLPPVTRNPALERIADDYACRMIAENFFGHRDPETGHGPGDRAVVGKYRFYAIGENLAAGQETAAEVMKVWMEAHHIGTSSSARNGRRWAFRCARAGSIPSTGCRSSVIRRTTNPSRFNR